MGFVSIKFSLALQLSLLLLGSFTVYGGEIVEAGVKFLPPIGSPLPSLAPGPGPVPSHLPHLPTRSFIAVQGVVYCKSCKYLGADTLLGASPLSGAIVKLQCNNSRHPKIHEAKTDKNGYFFLQAPKVSTYGVHKCKVFLVSSPLDSCKKPTNLNWGLSGAILKFEKPKTPVKFALFTVGPFAFAPTNATKCPL